MRLEGHASFIESVLHQLARGGLDLDEASTRIVGQLEILKLPNVLTALPFPSPQTNPVEGTLAVTGGNDASDDSNLRCGTSSWVEKRND
jgi:hypothetical protein